MKDPVRKSILRCRFARRHAAKSLALFFCTLLLLLTVPAHAGVLEETVARNFLSFVGSGKAILSAEPIEVSLLDPGLSPVVAGALFHLEGGGYLLVSGDRTVSPVKAYSLTNDFDQLPEPYRRALFAELELRVRAAQEAAAGRTAQEAGASETGARWDFLLNFTGGGRTPLAYTEGTALIQTLWNQDYPYNKFLPKVNGTQPVYAGCVNVALAQVMRYHKHPTASQGVLSYDWSGPPSQTLKTILYRTYNWDEMPNTVDGATPEYQANEVALLLRDLGIANQTHFGVSESGTSVNVDALLANFGYSTSLASMDNSDFAEFLTKIKTEIAAERPVLLSFPGHMTVADGYRQETEPVGWSVHVNMGWGGAENDFYFLDRTVDAGNYQFPVNPGALTIYHNIKPCNTANGDCAPFLEPGDGIAGFVIAGNFNRDRDTDPYEVYLKGPTTIAATRGYSKVNFFVSVLRADDGSTVFALSDNLEITDPPAPVPVGDLAADKYLVQVSLSGASGTFYPAPDPGFADYKVTLTSTDPTPQEKTTIGQALEKAPVIGSVSPGSPLPDLLLKTTGGTRKVLIDARDENGDSLTLSAQSSNPGAVTATLTGAAGNILELTPIGAKVSSRITVTAAANGKTTTKEFIVLTDDQETAFGKSATVAGNFSTQTEVDTHRAILDGTCTITGSRTGISNQAFFLKVYNAAGTLVAWSDGNPDSGSTITAPFNREIHRLEASLTSGGSHWNYDDGGNNPYAITISCANADDSTATIAGLLGISLAGANSIPGDITGDGYVNLADAILALQIASGTDTTGKTIKLERDVNGDGKIGLAEAIHALQAAAGLRTP